MKQALILIALIAAMELGPSSAIAKECNCQQHKAGADGSGSCSLTESSEKCSINYTASSSGSSSSSYSSSSSSADSRTEQERASAARIAAGVSLQIPIERAFETLNQRRPQEMSLDEFRAVSVGAFAATGSPDALSSWIKGMRLEGSFGRPDREFETLYRQFQDRGCIEFTESNTRTRFLLISRFSNRNGNCRN